MTRQLQGITVEIISSGENVGRNLNWVTSRWRIRTIETRQSSGQRDHECWTPFGAEGLFLTPLAKSIRMVTDCKTHFS